MGPEANRLETIVVLLVEDSPTDADLTREAFRETRVPVDLRIVKDGDEALDFLHGRPPHEDAPRPDVILLDLNMPRKSGHEVLGELEGAPRLRRIPVIVLTSSEDEEDVHRAYGLSANCYITKPVDVDEFLAVIRSIDDFWLDLVTLPRREEQ